MMKKLILTISLISKTKVFGFLAVAGIFALALSASVSAAHATRPIYLTRTSGPTWKTLRNDLRAFQAEADNVTRWWGGERVVLKVGRPPAGKEFIWVHRFDGELGWHTYTTIAWASVSAPTPPYSWTVTLSHELAEMMIDPGIDQFGFPTPFLRCSKEIADPVEDEMFTYDKYGVSLSDFVGPEWYNPQSTSTYLDYTGFVQHPWQVLPGGYQFCG